MEEKKYIYGYLEKNVSGRYALSEDYYFTSGNRIEILHNNAWTPGRIEFSQEHDDYYFLNEDLKIYIYELFGLAARVVNKYV